jgi:hypothetical protein
LRKNQTIELESERRTEPPDLEGNDRRQLVDWVKSLPDETRQKLAAIIISESQGTNQALPLDSIQKVITNEYSDFEKFLADNIESFSQGEAKNVNNTREAKKLDQILNRAKSSVLFHYLNAGTNQYRAISFRKHSQAYDTYLNASVDFSNFTLRGENAGSRIIRNIHLNEISDINWKTEAGEFQNTFCFVENTGNRTKILTTTYNKLITVRILETYIKEFIENYADIHNVDGLVKNQKVAKFELWLTSAEKVGIPSIDNEIKNIHGRFVSLLEKKVSMLQERAIFHLGRQEKEYILEGGPAIHKHEEEIAGGYSYRLIKNDPEQTRIELITPDQLSDTEKGSKHQYFRIPYFNTPESVTEDIPFVLTEWHLKLLIGKISHLSSYPTTNTLLMGLAGAGKDYFIKWLSSLMNVRLCSFDCRQVEEINDLFYTRRIRKGEDYFVPTDVYHAIKHPGCLIYLGEVNKLGEKFSDLNAMHDFKREVYMPVDGKTYRLPDGNLILASANPAWFGGGRSKLEPDVKDRYQNIINYDYLPFFSNPDSKRGPKYLSYEAEIRYRLFPQLEKMDQLTFRRMWNKLFQNGYDDNDDKSIFDRSNPYIKSVVVLKKVLQFVNLYRSAYKKFRTAKSDTVATEMLSQRSVEEIIKRIVVRDKSQTNLDTYKRVIRKYMHERFEDSEENDITVKQFLKN